MDSPCQERLPAPADDPQVDLREALYNDRAIGPAAAIQWPRERITRLHGILVDLDPKVLAPGNALFLPATDPEAFLAAIAPVLDRHPLARQAEVRASGTGLHLLIGLDPPVELTTAGAQRRWDCLVTAVQRSLPADLNAPGIQALTRPVGSINGKNGAVVRQLRAGTGVSAEAVMAFADRLAAAPFRTLVAVLAGPGAIAPCPLCRAEGSRLGVLDRAGSCYGCGPVSLDRLLDAILQPATAPGAATRPGAERRAARR
jgi:hypothetical protein